MFTLYNMFLTDDDGTVNDLTGLCDEEGVALNDVGAVKILIDTVDQDDAKSTLGCFGDTSQHYYAYGCLSVGGEKIAIKLYPSHAGYDDTTKTCVLDGNGNWIQANQRGKAAHVHGKLLGRIVTAVDKLRSAGFEFTGATHSVQLGSSSSGSVKTAPKAVNTLAIGQGLRKKLDALKK